MTNAGDDAVTAGAIGFPFSFYGTNYTMFFADTNANIVLTAVGSSSFSNACALASARSLLIAPMWDDMNLNRAGATGVHRICTVATGTAPSRDWVVTWEEVPYFSAAIPVTQPATFSAVMHETDSSIDFQWLTNCFRGSATIGVVGTGATQVTQVGTCNTAQTLDGNQVRLTYTP